MKKKADKATIGALAAHRVTAFLPLLTTPRATRPGEKPKLLEPTKRSA